MGKDLWLNSQNISNLEKNIPEITEDKVNLNWEPLNNKLDGKNLDINLASIGLKDLVGAFGPKEGVLLELQIRTFGNTGFVTLGPKHLNRNTGRVLSKLGR